MRNLKISFFAIGLMLGVTLDGVGICLPCYVIEG